VLQVLNALGVPRPLQDPSSGLSSPSYAYFTQVRLRNACCGILLACNHHPLSVSPPPQDNVFNNDTELAVPKAQVLREGMSIGEWN
jgi:hypothetical protein